MKKKETSYLQVKSIAEKIMITGDRPTIHRVYNLLGSVGTRKQIAIYLRRWRQECLDSHPFEMGKTKDIEEIIEARTQQLKQSLSLVRATLESTADGILMIDNEGKLVDFNKKFVEITHISKRALEKGEEQVGLESILALLEKPEEILELVAYLKKHPEIQGDMGEVKFKDGRIIERYSQPHLLGDEVVGRVWSFRDVTDRRRAEEALRLRERAITASPHGVLITDNNALKNIIYVNPAMESITGFPANELIGKKLNFFAGGRENEAEWEGLIFAIRENREGKAVLHNRKKGGEWYWSELSIAPVLNSLNDVTHFVVIMNDITERKSLEEQLMHQATHDALTDLPNRLLLEDRLRQLPLYSPSADSLSAILFLDLDRFKFINESLGHKVGDDLIKAIATRLQGIVRKMDTIARIGGDEFIIILMQIADIGEVERIATQMLESIREPIQLVEHELNITASIGVTIYPHDGRESSELIRNADTAMYHAKESGRDNFKFYHQQMNKRVSKVLMIENDLHKALEQKEFELYYQPVIDLKTRYIVGVEALIRWNHPELGLVSPVDFIYIAEEIGFITPLGEWTIEEACMQNVKWMKMGLPPLQMSVNISARQMRNGSGNKLLAYVKECLSMTGMPAELLALELTEGLFIDHSEDMINLLLSFKDIGVSLFIDDFGVGYSTLNYLRSFPIDKVKIDRTFISNIAQDADNIAIVKAILAMSKSLGLKVLAEGVETQEELKFLTENNCDEVQGYYFSKPIPADDCMKLIKENHGLLRKK